eukprot:762701-Hanusia_phi.AAC.4
MYTTSYSFIHSTRRRFPASREILIAGLLLLEAFVPDGDASNVADRGRRLTGTEISDCDLVTDWMTSST